MHKLPHEHLDMTLRDVLILADPKHAQGEAVDVSTITAAIEALATKIATDDEKRAERERTWLAEQFDELTTTLEVPDHHG